MPAIVLALVVLAVVALGIAWFLRANPSSLARGIRMVLVVLGAIAVGGMLIFGLRFGLIARALRNRPSGGFSSPGTGRRTEVRTAFLQAWIDHGTGDVGGTVLAGRFAGRTLDRLSDSELLDLHEECAGDADSLRVMEAYLDRRLNVDWRTARQPPPRGPRSDMTREEALAVLGLAEGASEEEIKAAHRRLIRRTHPDAGGTADLAARINRAKDVLVGG